MSEPAATQPVEGKSSLAAAKEDLEAAREESRPEPEHPPAELFHYCGVDGFYGIVTEKTLWMSDVFTLNDASEMLYARTIVDEVLRSQNPRPPWLKDITPQCEFLDVASKWGMYVSCFCAEGDLLSQWRGYGAQGGGFAIGFDRLRLRNYCQIGNKATNPLPLIYDKEEQRRHVQNLTRRACEIATNHNLKANDFQDFKDAFCFHLTTYMPQIKNPAFREESEWRLLRIDETPKFRPARGIIVPYLELSKIPPDVFKSVTLGPAVEPEFGLRPTKLFLESHGMTHVEVRQSQIPLRVVA
jgi:hypothetical protein